MLYAACFLRLLLAPYRAFLTRNRCLGETMLFCARRAPGLRPRRPRPACGRAGVPPSPRISARSLLPPIPPYSSAAFFAAAGPSAAPAGPLPALRPPQAPVSGRFGRGRPLGCACGPSAGLAAAPSPRFRALWPRLPSPAAFLPLIPPVAPSLRYRASCRASKVTVISHILPLFFVKCLRRTFFSLRYHIIFTIICYNNQNRITVMAHSRREEGHCRKKRRNRHGKNTHCGR